MERLQATPEKVLAFRLAGQNRAHRLPAGSPGHPAAISEVAPSQSPPSTVLKRRRNYETPPGLPSAHRERARS